jgi:hypothetical protein
VAVFDLHRSAEFRGIVTGTFFRKRSLGAILPPGLDVASIVLCDEHDDARIVPFPEARRLVRFPENVAELTELERRLLGAEGAPGGGGASG